MTLRRIATAGFQHETNTFSPVKAAFEDFEVADSWPGLLLGHDVVKGTQGLNLPIAGAIAKSATLGVTVEPILWCAAEPSGHVTDTAFERICDMILQGIDTLGPIDGIYLDLHGAMVTETHFDGEAALLARIRTLFGPDLPIAVSLDLHANISAELVALADVVTIYRTYPHLDMAETGERAMLELINCLDEGSRAVSLRQVPFLIPLHAQFTGADPCKHLYQLAQDLSETPGEYIDIALGFTASDVPDCGPAVIAYASSQARADALSAHLLTAFSEAAPAFDTRLFDARDAVRQAKEHEGPVILADVQDNPGAGGSSDTTGLLAALIDEAADKAILGMICDPEVATRAQIEGLGGIIKAALGGKYDPNGPQPLEAEFLVLALSDGAVAYTGEMYGGGTAQIGPSCLLQVSGIETDIKVVVSSVRSQCLDQAFFTHFELDPAHAQIICVKSTVHYRADFDRISRAILNVAAPGLFPCDLSTVEFENAQRLDLTNRSSPLNT